MESKLGIIPPEKRSDQGFDVGAKPHIPRTQILARYFLSTIYKYQFFESLCGIAGMSSNLSNCSIYGNEEAGEKLRAMMAAGASRPWPETFSNLTGTEELSASSILNYYAPLREWLNNNNPKNCKF